MDGGDIYLLLLSGVGVLIALGTVHAVWRARSLDRELDAIEEEKARQAAAGAHPAE
jgi:cell division protein FtsL